MHFDANYRHPFHLAGDSNATLDLHGKKEMEDFKLILEIAKGHFNEGEFHDPEFWKHQLNFMIWLLTDPAKRPPYNPENARN